ncbi:hypothetical protein [Varibaculum cambriense]|uniref:hypothetical protein n=1 Tax=Varibaculum cambriense TaxID=184870 RepID=UPI0024320F24|nr:hypothetical protein [Varibaculum cambriense]
MLKVFAWIFTILCAVLLAVGTLILYVIDTDSSFPFGAGFMVMAAPVFGVIGCVLWGVEITKTNRDQKE